MDMNEDYSVVGPELLPRDTSGAIITPSRIALNTPFRMPERSFAQSLMVYAIALCSSRHRKEWQPFAWYDVCAMLRGWATSFAEFDALLQRRWIVCIDDTTKEYAVTVGFVKLLEFRFSKRTRGA